MKHKWLYILAGVLVIGMLMINLQNLARSKSDGIKKIQLTIIDGTNDRNESIVNETYYTSAKDLEQFLTSEKSLDAKIDPDGVLTQIAGLEQDPQNGPWLVYDSKTNPVCQKNGACPSLDRTRLSNGDTFVIVYLDEEQPSE